MHFGIYKRELANRSRIAAAVSIAILTVMGANWLKGLFVDTGTAFLGITWGQIIAAVFVIGSVIGIAYLVNSRKCVDFLIETEAELAKVSWPSRKEFLGATAVVLFTMFFLALYLFILDLILSKLLKLIALY